MRIDRSAVLVALVFSLLVLSGCGSGINPNYVAPASAAPPVATQGGSVTLSPQYAALEQGRATSFTRRSRVAAACSGW
jgi:ABC-type phosphate transport system substrate-binding protein